MQQRTDVDPGGLSPRRSRQTAVLVNLVKVALLAALAPPVVAGISDRATRFGAPTDPATVVGVAISLGAIGAVLGAVVIGRCADLGRGTHRSRWAWVAAGAAIGTAGLGLAAVSTSPATLIGGWILAQLGYSGAMAVLRALLASVRQTHLRRGAVAVVFAAYGGLTIPLVLLLLFPTAVWETSLGLAALALIAPLLTIACFPPARTGAALDATLDVASDAGRDAGPAPQPAPRPASGPASRSAAPSPVPGATRSRGRAAGVFLLQCLSTAVIAALIAYNPLDLNARISAGSFPTAASTWVLIAAVLGLVGATAVLFWLPALLASSRVILVTAGVLLAMSLVMRAVSDTLALTIGAAVLSGIAVGANNSALLSAALEMAPAGRQGRFIGLFSAAGALGQFVGPLLGLAILRFGSPLQVLDLPSSHPYSLLMITLAMLPLGWSIALTIARIGRRGRTPAGATPADAAPAVAAPADAAPADAAPTDASR